MTNPNFVFNIIHSHDRLRDIWTGHDLFAALISEPRWRGTENLVEAVAGRVGSSVQLSNARLMNYGRTFDADDVVFTDVGVGENTPITGILIHTRTLPVIGITDARGMPAWANGGDIIVEWENGPTRIATIDREIIRRVGSDFVDSNAARLRPEGIAA